MRFYAIRLRTVVIWIVLSMAIGAIGGWTAGSIGVWPAAGKGGPVPIFDVPAAGKAMSLTVNVDWGEEHLPAMLDAFHRHGARVTFFITGTWARNHAELVRSMVEAGHEIGNHGFSHAHPKSLSSQAFAQHILGNEPLLEEMIGHPGARLYAPPYGEWDERIVRMADAHGYRTILWTLDTIDWQDPSPETILQRIVPRARDGAIVLMHPRANTVAALEPMLDKLIDQGFALVPVGELLVRGASGT